MKLLYGYKDPKNAIECELIETKYIDGEFIYIARCNETECIQAPVSAFQTFFRVVILDQDGVTRDNYLYATTPEDATRRTETNSNETIFYAEFA